MPSFQDSNLLRLSEGAQVQEIGLEQRKFIPRLHHFVQARHPRSLCLPSQEVVLHGPRRGTKHQEFQESTLADTTQIQHEEASPTYRYSLAERRDGALVTHALPHATDIQQPVRLQGVVLKPIQPIHQSQPINQHRRRAEAPVDPQTLPPPQDEERC